MSLRMLRRQYELDDDALDELIEELVDVQRVARREENVLVWAAQPKPDTVARAPVTARAADQADARKVVTIVFADLVGSTALHERLDPESVQPLHGALLRGDARRGRSARRHGGEAARRRRHGRLRRAARRPRTTRCAPCAPAVGMQQAFRAFAGDAAAARVGDIGLRVAVNTGEVVVSDDAHRRASAIRSTSRRACSRRRATARS